jgi:hypothetical protein
LVEGGRKPKVCLASLGLCLKIQQLESNTKGVPSVLGTHMVMN